MEWNRSRLIGIKRNTLIFLLVLALLSTPPLLTAQHITLGMITQEQQHTTVEGSGWI